MYFCPFCGGKLPDSSKPIHAPYLTPEERARLEELIEGITSPEEAIARLGTPDYDELMLTYYAEGDSIPVVYSGPQEEQHAIQEAGKLRLDQSVRPTRNMEFYGLSKTGNIELYFDEGKPPHHVVMPKLLSPRHLEEGEEV